MFVKNVTNFNWIACWPLVSHKDFICGQFEGDGMV